MLIRNANVASDRMAQVNWRALVCCVFAAVAITGLVCPSSSLAASVKMPEPIRAWGDAQATRDAIITAMGIRNWVLEREEPGRILATLRLRRHVAKAWIDYSTEQIRFTYGGSVNMKCKLAWPLQDPPRCESIHGRYNTWLRNLRNDIEKEVARSR